MYDVQPIYTKEVLSAAEELLAYCPHSDKDLSSLRVYAIDVDEDDELDDALSATRLPDGRIKVWIHVAGPTCFLQPWSIIDCYELWTNPAKPWQGLPLPIDSRARSLFNASVISTLVMAQAQSKKHSQTGFMGTYGSYPTRS